MQAPLSGSNDTIHHQISDENQTSDSAGAGKLFLVSEDRLKILASLAQQVFQMCEEFYKVEFKPSETTAHAHWEMMKNVHIGDMNASTAGTNPVSQERSVGGGQSEHGIPVLEETTENLPKTSVGKHIRGGDILLDDNVVSTNTQPEMMESIDMKEDDEKSNESSEGQMIQVKTEDVSDQDPDAGAGYNIVAHTQPEIYMYESPSTMKDEDVSIERSEWQITDIKTPEQATGYYIGSALTCTERPSDRESVPTIPSTSVMTKDGRDVCEIQQRDKHIQRNKAIKGKTIVKTGSHRHPECEKIVSFEDVCRYMETHSGEKSDKCGESGVTLTRQKHLQEETEEKRPHEYHDHRKHLRIHTGEKTYQCRDCDETFTQQIHLCMHMRTHTGVEPFQCQECDKTFTRKSNLLAHMRTHTGEKPHQCQECGRAFAFKPNLNKHMRKHTGEKPFKCEECDKTFTQQGSLLKHIRTHTGEKPYQCQVCGTAFACKTYLLKHMRRHTGEKPFKCKECDKTFTQQGSLVKHMRTHTGERPFICKECGAAFTQQQNLRTHIRIHTGEKPFQCQDCGRPFSCKSNLTKHISRTHSGEKPFKYEECDNPFYQQVSLMHMKTHEKKSAERNLSGHPFQIFTHEQSMDPHVDSSVDNHE